MTNNETVTAELELSRKRANYFEQSHLRTLEDLSGMHDKLRARDEAVNILRDALEEAKGFAEWIEILGRTDCEIYKHELKGSADLSLQRIDKALEQHKR